MRLTIFLCKKKLPNGHIYRGKYRLVKEVDAKARADLRREYAIEEKNMLLLRHPYLSIEQSSGHAKELGKHEQWVQKVKDDYKKNWREHITLEDRLSHLKVKEAWD